MIRILAQAFDFGNIFLESKTNMDQDKKEWKQLKKTWFWQRFNMPC